MGSPPCAIRAGMNRALWLSTTTYMVSFAAWTLLSVIAIQVAGELALTETEFGLLVATPLLTGSIFRVLLVPWVERYGARHALAGVMIISAIATFLLSMASTYAQMLVSGLAIGIVGASFIVSVAHISRWYPTERQSRALDVLGIGIVGAGVTHVVAPVLLAAHGWRAVAQVWAAGLLATAAFVWVALREQPAAAGPGPRLAGFAASLSQLGPLKNVQVWRFALYYFFVFGAFIALVLWLPRYVVEVYHLDIETAGLIAAAFSLSAGLGRLYGGVLVRDYGARRIMYWTFMVAVACTFVLSYPVTDYEMGGAKGPIAFHAETGVVAFTSIIVVLAAFMAFGQAAVFEHIPVYYPKHVAVVGGLVGMVGGLGGFVLPVAFGVLNELMGVRQSCFMLLFALVSMALIWMHIAIRYMEREKAGAALKKLPELPEMAEIHGVQHEGALGARAAYSHSPVSGA